MLKPWVVHVAVWAYKVLGVLLLLAVVLTWWENRHALPSPRWRKYCLATTSAFVLIFLFGQPRGFADATLILAVFSPVFYGVLLVIDTTSRRTLLVLLPLLPVGCLVLWVYLATIDLSAVARLLVAEQRLSAGLFCRTYPLRMDSVLATGLVLLREGKWLRDDVVEQLNGYSGTSCFSCNLQPDGSVELDLRDCTGSTQLSKRSRALR